MNHLPASPATTTNEIADMNGPLAYWGPATPPITSGGAPVHRPPSGMQTERSGLARLALTVNGRTWTGTSALMSAAIGLPAAA